MKFSDALIGIAKEINSDSTISIEKLMLTIKKLQADFETKPLPSEELRFFDEKIFPSKQSIITFVKECYNEKIPTSWTHKKVLERATQIVQGHGLPKYNLCLERYTQLSLLPRRTIEMNVFAMELDDIKREFENIEKYPTVASIRQVLPSSLRSILKDVTNRDYAIKKLVDEIKQLRSVSKIQDIFSKKGQ